MDVEAQRDQGPHGQPSLAEMTQKAIEILQRPNKGYFLFVEGMMYILLLVSYLADHYWCRHNVTQVLQTVTLHVTLI